MGKIAFVFDGKGTQYPGMGKEFFDDYYVIKQQLTYLEQYRVGILRTMFFSTNKDLENSIDLYPGLFLADLASYLALKKHGIKPDVVAGFGVGEMMAITPVCISPVLMTRDISPNRSSCRSDIPKLIMRRVSIPLIHPTSPRRRWISMLTRLVGRSLLTNV